MGSCLSTWSRVCDVNPVPYPSPFATPLTTHILAVKIPHLHNLWYYEYRLYDGPITIGQKVALYERDLDSPDPDPDQATPVIEGWINEIFGYGPRWVMFGIINSAGKRVARLSHPDYPDPQLLMAYNHPSNQTHPSQSA
ncbi:hypothetical protein PILCRDRAFT_88993 [Piloderma croceum F 1598]|uniref:Uncharacterized protein n=1 Tax=Piloderma croceum (strain F 1598) TaxID=765440 RepID=A0A0C3FRX6_PILCF|nr:hypothetical protein PILCRDRAFT_88993 [Piloderma croceum F 1598]